MTKNGEEAMSSALGIQLKCAEYGGYLSILAK
jgi:hypothetical protein